MGRSMPRQCSSGSILLPSVRPYPGTFGNVGRDTLTGPGLSELDFALVKSTTIHERLRAQFRAEFFNVLNHSNFTTPNPVVYQFRSEPEDSDGCSAPSRRRPESSVQQRRPRGRFSSG